MTAAEEKLLFFQSYVSIFINPCTSRITLPSPEQTPHLMSAINQSAASAAYTTQIVFDFLGYLFALVY
jgi:hypothetical protein